MKCLREKWNSRRGASILLALLFLLVCMLAAASVLMAAVSNAGKARSSREEQQKYLTLSSAMTLVCDALNEAEYKGRYDYKKEDIKKPETATNPDGSETTNWVHDYWLHTYTRKPGTFTCSLNTPLAVLPLNNDLDAFFAEHFTKADSGDNRYVCNSPATGVLAKSHALSLTAELTGENIPGLEQPVKVNVEWNRSSGHIELRAELEDGEHVYAMKAELRADKAPGEVLKLKDDPASDGTYDTGPMSWTLSWIVKD